MRKRNLRIYSLFSSYWYYTADKWQCQQKIIKKILSVGYCLQLVNSQS